MITRDLQEQLSFLLIHSIVKGKAAMLAIADEHDITLMQASSLCLLSPEESRPMSYLSNFLTCDPSNITSIVEGLVSGGFIERREDTKDRRVKNLTLTESGKKLRSELLKATAEKRLPAIGTLSSVEVSMLVELMSRAAGVSPVAHK